jgi:hypothetical protein
MEIRFGLKAVEGGGASKGYRIIYRADIKGSDNPSDDAVGKLCSGIKPLSEYGLYIPTNAPALLAAVRVYKADPVEELRPAFLWCEGEKARLALEARCGTEEALELFASRGVTPVTAATLGGMTGVKHTNYLLAPGPYAPPAATVAGKNDEPLDLSAAIHYIILDNDVSGRAEGYALAARFLDEYEVPRDQIDLVDPP